MDKKYMKLYRELRQGIENGTYPAGSRLPSKRTLSDVNGCSHITVETAYGLLTDEGYITPEERRGYFVTETARAPDRGGKERRPVPLPLPDMPAERDVPLSVWNRTVRKVLAEKDALLFARSPGMGCEILRNAIADYLFRYRKMSADPRRIVIGSGAEQLYEFAVRILGRDRIFGREEPCYRQISFVYEGMGVKTRPLPLGSDGIEEDALFSADSDVLHVTPFHSYPSGVSTSAGKRQLYLQWVEKAGRYIVEDDYDSEFFLPGHPIPSLYSMDTGGRVIYINTFSKSISPAMRIGYMILPEALLPVYEEKLGMLSCTVPVPDQYFLAEFIASGDFERHLNRKRRRLTETACGTAAAKPAEREILSAENNKRTDGNK